MSPRSTYIRTSNFDFKPGTGPIALGNLIADPMSPHHPLITVDSDTLKKYYHRIDTFKQNSKLITRGSRGEFARKRWRATRASAKASYKEMAKGAKFTVKGVEGSYFAHGISSEVLERLVKAPQVQEAMEANRVPGFRKPVYMITGIMVVKDLEIRQERATDAQKVKAVRRVSDNGIVGE